MGDLKLGDAHLAELVPGKVWVCQLVVQSRKKGTISGIRFPQLKEALEKVALWPY